MVQIKDLQNKQKSAKIINHQIIAALHKSNADKMEHLKSSDAHHFDSMAAEYKHKVQALLQDSNKIDSRAERQSNHYQEKIDKEE